MIFKDSQEIKMIVSYRLNIKKQYYAFDIEMISWIPSDIADLQESREPKLGNVVLQHSVLRTKF